MADYKNLKASDGTGNAVLATITNNRAVSGTILEVTSVENWPNEFIVMTGTLDANGYIEAASATEMKAHLTGADIEIDSFEPGYTDVGNTSGQVAIIKMTTSWADDITELAQVSHNDDGTLKDNIVTNEKLKTGAGEPGGAWDTWTPTWSNVTIGNAVVTARYKQVGKTVTCRLSVALGSTTTTSGDIIFSLPVPSIAYPGVSGLHPIGTSRYFDVSASVVYIGDVENISTTTSSSRFFSNAGSYSGQILNTGGLPIVWGNGDQWAMSFTYEAA